MPQIIEIPNVGQVEFPDGMSDAEISEAIKRNTPAADPWASFARSQRAEGERQKAEAAAAAAAPSDAGSFAREGLRSVVPGIAGFASGAASGAGLGAMGLNPITVALGAIGGGIAGAMGTRYVQDGLSDEIAPDSFMGTASTAQDWQTNPISSLIGGAIAQGRPAPMRALGAARSIATADGRALLGQAFRQGATPAATAALTDVADVGLGAGVGAGMSLAMGDGMAAENAALGALFNRPWMGGGMSRPVSAESVNTRAPELVRADTGVSDRIATILKPSEAANNPNAFRPRVDRFIQPPGEDFNGGPSVIGPIGPIVEGPMITGPKMKGPRGPIVGEPLEADPISGYLPAPVPGRRDSPPLVDVPQQDANRIMINQLEEEYVTNRTRREALAAKFKDDGKPLNSGDGRKMIGILDKRAATIDSQLEILRSGEVITPPAPARNQIIEVDGRQPKVAPVGAPPVDQVVPPVAPVPETVVPPAVKESLTVPPVVDPVDQTAQIEAIHYSREPLKLEKGKDIQGIPGRYQEESIFGEGFYAMEPKDEKTWTVDMQRFDVGPNRNEIQITPKRPVVITPQNMKDLSVSDIRDGIKSGKYDAVIIRGFDPDQDTLGQVQNRVDELWKPQFTEGKTSGRFTNVSEYHAALEKATQEIVGVSSVKYGEFYKSGLTTNQIFIPKDSAPDIVNPQRASNNSKAKLAALPEAPPKERRWAKAGTVKSENPDFIDFIHENPVNVPPKGQRSGGEWDGIEDFQRSLVPLYKSDWSEGRGRGIDLVAQAAFEKGLISEPTGAAVREAYMKAIADRKLVRTTGDLNPIQSRDRQLRLKEPKQAKEFDSALAANRRSRAGQKVLAGELSEGDKFTFQGEPFKVIKDDTVEGFDGPEGNIVLQDHDKFGVQIVDAETPLRIADKERGQVFGEEADRADEVLRRRRPVIEDEETIPMEDDEPSWLSKPEKPVPSPEPTAKAAEPFDLETQTEESIKSEAASAKTKAEIAKRQAAPLKGDAGDTTADIFGEGETPLFNERRDNKPVSPDEKKSILDGLKAHRESVNQSIKDGRGKSYMSIAGVTPADVKLIYRTALDVAIAAVEAGQSVSKAVKAAIANIKAAAPRITPEELKVVKRQLFTEAETARKFGNDRDAKLKVEMPKVAAELEAGGIPNPTIGDLVSALVNRFPDQAAYIRANSSRLFDEMVFQRNQLQGKSPRAREWEDWLDSGMEQAAKVIDWAKRGTPFRDIASKLSLFNRTFFGTIGAKMHYVADGRYNGKASESFQKFVNEFVGLEAGTHGVHHVSIDARLRAETTAFSNKLDAISSALEDIVSKMPKGERAAFFERITDHVTDPTRDGELASQPALKAAVEGIVKLRRELYDVKIAAGVDMGNAGPRSMTRKPDASKILGNEKEFVNQAAKAYTSVWAREIRTLRAEAATARAAGKTKEAARLMEKIADIQKRDAADDARKYLHAVQSADLGITSDGEGDLFSPHNGNPNSEQSRVFGPDADQFLGKFYERNAFDLLARDILDSMRSASVAKALSAKAPDGSTDPLGRWKELRKSMEEEGNRDMIPVAAELIKNYFNLGGSENPKARRFLELSHTHTQIGRLSHAMLASLGEPVLAGMRSGRGAAGILAAYKETAKSLVRRLRSADPSEWAITADFMGATTAGLNPMLNASRHMDAFGGRTGSRLISRFHVLTMLTDFTNATHETAIRLGHAHILAQLKTAANSGKLSGLSRRYLNEVGITGADIKSVLQFAERVEGSNPADRAKLLTADTADARKYRDALHLFRESGGSLDPTRGTRPEYANTPLGSMFYQLSSFLYAFHEKVTKRSYRYMKDAAKGKTMVDGSEVALSTEERTAIVGNLLTGVAAIASTQYGIQILRETLLADPVRIQKDKNRTPEEIRKIRMMSAASRTGVLGPYDMLFNMITGARYQRDPATAMLGPALGGASELFGNTVRLLNERVQDSTNSRDGNGPQSNYTARKFGRNVSDMLVTPALSAVGASLPGRIPGGLVIQGVSSPSFREKVTSTIGGPMRIEKKRTDKKN